MTVKVGINGFGRIGRLVFRTIKERHAEELEVVAVNDLFDSATNAHLLKYDSTYGKYPGTVEAQDGNLLIDGKTVKVSAEKDPAAIKWQDMGVEIVIESTGFFTDATKAINTNFDCHFKPPKAICDEVYKMILSHRLM